MTHKKKTCKLVIFCYNAIVLGARRAYEPGTFVKLSRFMKIVFFKIKHIMIAAPF